MKVKSESEVAQSCPTLSDPMDCSLPGSCVHGIFRARVLEWGAIAFSDITFRDIYLKILVRYIIFVYYFKFDILIEGNKYDIYFYNCICLRFTLNLIIKISFTLYNTFSN